MSEADSNRKEKDQEEERAKKIKMAIWVFNKLIDRYPLIYTRLKEEYERSKNR
jgi:hypothetical protein